MALGTVQALCLSFHTHKGVNIGTFSIGLLWQPNETPQTPCLTPSWELVLNKPWVLFPPSSSRSPLSTSLVTWAKHGFPDDMAGDYPQPSRSSTDLSPLLLAQSSDDPRDVPLPCHPADSNLACSNPKEQALGKEKGEEEGHPFLITAGLQLFQFPSLKQRAFSHHLRLVTLVVEGT